MTFLPYLLWFAFILYGIARIWDGVSSIRNEKVSYPSYKDGKRIAVQLKGLLAIRYGWINAIFGLLIVLDGIIDIFNRSAFLLLAFFGGIMTQLAYRMYSDKNANKPEYAHMRQVVDKRKNEVQKVKEK